MILHIKVLSKNEEVYEIHSIFQSIHIYFQFKYAKIDSAQNNKVKSGVIFSTYSALISGTKNASKKFDSRLKQLIDWCGKDFDGCIIFDECHKAKHLIPSAGGKPTKTGMTVLQLQNELPNARVVYASATGFCFNFPMLISLITFWFLDFKYEFTSIFYTLNINF